VIRLQELTKRYPGQPSAAVDGLTLDIGDGETCVLIGPSGCGKTTTMKMVNRLIEPTSGRVEIDGRDVSRLDPVALRRSIGYVIQQVGLFPHLTIADNVATVPRLLGWPGGRIDARVDEMLALVGLDPAIYRSRYPRELSGGQRQRVGVARALAGDPPVMLMDEPFAAVDPITRDHLQTEFLRILGSLGKTIVFVTHDVDEAIRMGQRIAVLRDGRLVQHGTPHELLAQPADRFVEAFLGADRALKALRLLTAGEAMRTDASAVSTASTGPLASIEEGASLRDGLAAILASGVPHVAVVDGGGRVIGVLSLSGVQQALHNASRHVDVARRA
jgi:osmoprotectant transport system ATP-binding protein